MWIFSTNSTLVLICVEFLFFHTKLIFNLLYISIINNKFGMIFVLSYKQNKNKSYIRQFSLKSFFR